MDNHINIDLSIKCSKCGATNKFSLQNIPTNCTFCGATLPDMHKHVDEAIRIGLEHQRMDMNMAYDYQHHAMDMEKMNKELRKERFKSTASKVKSVAEIIGSIVRALPYVVMIIAFIMVLIMIIRIRLH